MKIYNLPALVMAFTLSDIGINVVHAQVFKSCKTSADCSLGACVSGICLLLNKSKSNDIKKKAIAAPRR